jgi:hypothetical protein
MSSTGLLAEETGLIGSKTVKRKLFLDDTVDAAAGGRITGSSFGYFGLAMEKPDVSHASNCVVVVSLAIRTIPVLILGIV